MKEIEYEYNVKYLVERMRAQNEDFKESDLGILDQEFLIDY